MEPTKQEMAKRVMDWNISFSVMTSCGVITKRTSIARKNKPTLRRTLLSFCIEVSKV